jgi:hypothetical protein
VATARQLLSDFTGGEVSPRVDARADLEKYGSALRLAENVVLSMQGGMLKRCGTERMGSALSSGVTPVPESIQIPWRSGDPDDDDLVLEITGNVMRGWTNAGRVTVGGNPYSITLPVAVDSRTQWAQRANTIVLTSSDRIPVIITINAIDDWTAVPLSLASIPVQRFGDAIAPPKQNTVVDVTFVGFNAGNTYNVYVNGLSVKGFVKTPLSPIGVARTVLPVSYSSASTLTNRSRIANAIRKSSFVPNPDEVTVTWLSGTTYRISLSGSIGGLSVNLVAAAESGAIRIEVENNADGRDGEEPAWSYPLVVTHSGVYYQCIKAHVSTVTTPDADAVNWLPLVGAPAWESLQPSEAWSSGSVSYGLQGRGWPSCCAFFDQRLVLAATPYLPKTFWGSAIGDIQNFTLGVEDNEALSREIDAQDSPSIRWMAAQNGLIIGTSAGIYRASGQVTLTPADVSIEMYTADRAAARVPVVIGNELLCISQDHTVLLAIRRNDRIGPYEGIDLTGLAEHLGRYRMERLVYCRQPQPLLYIQTREPGLLLCITYNRQYEMVAFSRVEINGTIEAMAPMFDPDDGDVLWLSVRRGNSTSIERLRHPDTRVPGAASTTETVHLDGWIRASDTAGTVSGLRHLLGRTVTVLNNAGAVQGTATVVAGGAPSAETPVTVPNAGFESLLVNWTTVAGFVANSAVSRTGSQSGAVGAGAFFGASYSEIRSDPIAVTPGRTYRVALYWRHVTSGAGCVPLIVRIRDAGGAQVGGAVVGPQPDNTVSWTKAEVTFNTPANAASITIGASASSLDVRVQVNIDDVEMGWTQPTDGVITATGTSLIIGEPFLGKAITMEPITGNPEGTATGKRKRFSEIIAKLYQSALPKINGNRPSDPDQSDPRANPGLLRTGEYEVNTSNWRDGSVTVEMDLPHRTEIVALYGDLKVN